MRAACYVTIMLCMAKRGEKQPWKVRYEWSNGIKGTVARSSQELAEIKADEIRRAGELRSDADVTVTVEKVG